MRIAIVGHGVVGKHMANDIRRAGHVDLIRDPLLPHSAPRPAINACDAAFVCVPTPMAEDGSADLSAIREVFSWLRVPVAIIRSTVTPGTTRMLQETMAKTGFRYVVFMPEFYGEGVNHPYANMSQPPFLIIGGGLKANDAAVQVMSRIYNSDCEFVTTDSLTAELVKYAENAYLATRVTFFNEWFDVVRAFGGNWPAFINALAHDTRIGRSHTHVYEGQRGWDGRCLPKDVSAILHSVGLENMPLMAAVQKVNQDHRNRSTSGKGVRSRSTVK